MVFFFNFKTGCSNSSQTLGPAFLVSFSVIYNCVAVQLKETYLVVLWVGMTHTYIPGRAACYLVVKSSVSVVIALELGHTQV